MHIFQGNVQDPLSETNRKCTEYGETEEYRGI